MKRIMVTVLALVALAACESAVASEAKPRTAAGAEVVRNDPPPLLDVLSTEIAVASVRKQAGTLYMARGLSTTGQVHVQVRSSTTGFQGLTSGTLVAEDTYDAPVDVPFTVTAGTRYLIVAYPHANSADDPDGASFVEITP